MATHNDLGKKGEAIALAHLCSHGFEILETNWVSGKAEIDIIAKKDNVLCIVEVKTRSSVAFGLPQDFVTPKKIRMLLKAVNQFIQGRDMDCDVRFDIIGITNAESGFIVEHIADAFYYF